MTAPNAVHHRSGSTLCAAATAASSLFHTSTECSPGGRPDQRKHAQTRRRAGTSTIYGCSTSQRSLLRMIRIGLRTVLVALVVGCFLVGQAASAIACPVV